MFIELKKISHFHQRIIIASTLFIFIFVTLGLPYKGWWFRGRDDFHGLYLGYKTKTWKELLHFFYEGHTDQGIGPTNTPPMERTSFFKTSYRPLYCVYLALQYWLFGTNAYAYFLCNVFVHAINTALFFLLFSWFIPIIPATLTALLFALHPAIAYRFGDIVNFHFYLNVLLMLLIIIALKKYLASKNYCFNLIASLLFILSLFTRESTIVLPAILWGGVFLYENNFIKAYWATVNFWFIALSFLLLRLLLYPLATAGSTTSFAFKKFLTDKVGTLIMASYDAFGISWLPWGYPLLRGTVMLLLIIFFIWLFIHNRQKKWILFFLASAGLMLWPAFLRCYHDRYCYEFYPFVLSAFICCFKYYDGSLAWIKKIGIPLWITLIAGYFTLTIHSFSRREQKFKLMRKATYELVNNPQIKNRALCFVGYPLDSCGDQNPQIYWILFNNPKLPLYFDQATALTQGDSETFLITPWCNTVPLHHDENFFTIKKTGNLVRLTTLDPHKIQFAPADIFSLGKKVIHQTKKLKGKKVITDFTLEIDEKWLIHQPLFISWNYKTKKFILI